MKGEFTKEASVVFTEKGSYLKTLRDRKKASRVYKKHQMTGLELAAILDDPGHKSFYMKLAKEKDGDELFRVAKDVASRTNIRNKGAYFMRLIHLAEPKAKWQHK